LNSKTGREIWQNTDAPNITSLVVDDTDNIIYVGSSNGYVFAISNDGTTLRTTQLDASISPDSIKLADINDDGKLDVVVGTD
jgi:outer membrane protein assembly factor BamB